MGLEFASLKVFDLLVFFLRHLRMILKHKKQQ
jgi:hypothetical protein